MNVGSGRRGAELRQKAEESIVMNTSKARAKSRGREKKVYLRSWVRGSR